jgi:MFS family permease
MNSKIYYGYWIVAFGSIIQAMYIGCVFTFGVLFPSFEAEFGWSRATIAGASSIMTLVMGILGIFMGRVNDAFGPRIVLTVATALFAAGFLLMYRMNSVWELYLFYGLLGGLGMGAVEVVTLSTVARWFIQFRGLMSGIVKAGAGIGQVIIPLSAAILISTYGWRVTCLLIGAPTLLIMVFAAQMVRRDPGQVGLRPLGDDGHPNSQLSPSAGEGGLTFSQALTTRGFSILSVVQFLQWFTALSIIIHIVPHGIDLGLKPSRAAMVLSTIGGCSILGRILLGSIFDRIGTKQSLATCFLMLILAFFLLQASTDPRLMFVFALIYGIAHGGLFAIASPSVAQYCGMRSHGMIFGFVIFFGTLGGTAGPFLTGRIFDVTGGYDIAFWILIGFAILGLLLSLALRPPVKSITPISH